MSAGRSAARSPRISILLAIASVLIAAPILGADPLPAFGSTPAVTAKPVQEKLPKAGDVTEVAKAKVSQPVYKPPRRGSPRAKVSGGMRGVLALPTPLALAPAHLAHTVSDQPSLFWHIDAVPSRGSRLVFTLIDEDSIEPLAEVSLESPAQAGIQRIRLTDLGIHLEPEIEYEWSVALVPDPARRARDVISTGYLRRVGQPEELAEELANLAPGRGGVDTYAALGLWYDALEAISDSIDSAPADPTLRGHRNALFRQGELELAMD